MAQRVTHVDLRDAVLGVLETGGHLVVERRARVNLRVLLRRELVTINHFCGLKNK